MQVLVNQPSEEALHKFEDIWKGNVILLKVDEL
jgi:hypothetical protein